MALSRSRVSACMAFSTFRWYYPSLGLWSMYVQLGLPRRRFHLVLPSKHFRGSRPTFMQPQDFLLFFHHWPTSFLQLWLCSNICQVGPRFHCQKEDRGWTALKRVKKLNLYWLIWALVPIEFKYISSFMEKLQTNPQRIPRLSNPQLHNALRQYLHIILMRGLGIIESYDN